MSICVAGTVNAIVAFTSQRIDVDQRMLDQSTMVFTIVFILFAGARILSCSAHMLYVLHAHTQRKLWRTVRGLELHIANTLNTFWQACCSQMTRAQ